MIRLQSQTIATGYDRRRCWVHARCARMPQEGGSARLVLTMQYSQISSEDHVSDIFSGLYGMTSDDEGESWSEPASLPNLGRWSRAGGIEVAVADFTPQWLPVNQRLLGMGCTVEYRGSLRVKNPVRHEVAYAFYNAESLCWSKPRMLEISNRNVCSAGCIQWVELPDGDLLIPVTWKKDTEAIHHVSVFRCRLRGLELVVLEEGPTLSLPFARGFVEPSLTEFGGQFWLTIRNDFGAYLAISQDGLHYPKVIPWHFCNGRPLGSYNTQQHWARVGERLFLVYTRSGLDNDHIVRHRAPLLMAEVDPARLCLLKETEQIIVPERGAPLGNFGVSQNGPGEALICVSEWMENAGSWNYEVWDALEKRFPDADLHALAKSPGRCQLCELSGSDNSIYLLRASQVASCGLLQTTASTTV